MADNVTLDAGSGGAAIKTDDDGTAHWQYIKLAFGADNTQTIVTSSVGVPTTLLAGTAEIGKLAAGVAEIGNVKNSGTFATQATLQAGTAEVGKLAAGVAEIGNVKNSGTFVVQEDGAALTALQLIDDAIFTDDGDWTATSSKHALIGGVYQSTPGTITDGDTGPIRLDANGAVHINDGGNSITIDGTVTANAGTGTLTVDGSGVTQPVSGTVTANLGATDNAVIDQIEVNTSYGDNTGAGTEASSLRVTIANDSTGLLSVDDNGGSLTVDNGGTFATQATLQAGTAEFGKLAAGVAEIGNVKNSGTFAVQSASAGDVAHDSADSGNPVKIGAKVETSLKGITAAADGDRTDLYADSDGVQVVKLNSTGADHVSERISNTDGASTAFTNFSAVASTYNYVHTITAHNSSASDAYIDIRDGTAGSVLWTIPIPAGGGATISGGGYPLFKSSANTALAYDVSAATTTVYLSMAGYQSKV